MKPTREKISYFFHLALNIEATLYPRIQFHLNTS